MGTERNEMLWMRGNGVTWDYWFVCLLRITPYFVTAAAEVKSFVATTSTQPILYYSLLYGRFDQLTADKPPQKVSRSQFLLYSF